MGGLEFEGYNMSGEGRGGGVSRSVDFISNGNWGVWSKKYVFIAINSIQGPCIVVNCSIQAFESWKGVAVVAHGQRVSLLSALIVDQMSYGIDCRLSTRTKTRTCQNGAIVR